MNKTIPKSELSGADKKEVGTYTRALTTDEKATIAETIAKVAEDEEAHAEARKQAMADMRERAKELSTRRKDLLKQKRTGYIEESDDLYTFLVTEERTAYVFNSKGEQVQSRRMTADEHQLAIPHEGVVSIRKAAN
jgi:hypothetical protein